jgi:hypothetical protein
MLIQPKISIVVFLLILSVGSCKKPKKGHYRLSFFDTNQYTIGGYDCDLAKNGTLTFSPVPHSSPSGNLTFTGNHVEGIVFNRGGEYGHYSTEITTLSGTVERKEMTGTFVQETDLKGPYGSVYDTTVHTTKCGNFKMSWQSK